MSFLHGTRLYLLVLGLPLCLICCCVHVCRRYYKKPPNKPGQPIIEGGMLNGQSGENPLVVLGQRGEQRPNQTAQTTNQHGTIAVISGTTTDTYNTQLYAPPSYTEVSIPPPSYAEVMRETNQ